MSERTPESQCKRLFFLHQNLQQCSCKRFSHVSRTYPESRARISLGHTATRDRPVTHRTDAPHATAQLPAAQPSTARSGRHVQRRHDPRHGHQGDGRVNRVIGKGRVPREKLAHDEIAG